MIKTLNKIVDNNFAFVDTALMLGVTYCDLLIGYGSKSNNNLFIKLDCLINLKIIDKVYDLEKKNEIKVLISLGTNSMKELNDSISKGIFKESDKSKLHKILIDTFEFFIVPKIEIEGYSSINNVLKYGNRNKIIDEIL